MSSRLYVGRLPRCDERDIEDFFKGYGRIRDVKIMQGFAFVEFEDSRDARDAVQDLSGKPLLGERISVEFAKPPRSFDEDRRGGGGRYDDDRDDRRGGGDRYDRGPERPLRFARPRRTGFRAIVENLEPSVSWQDLKDFARTAGEVTFADCHRDREGVGAIEYAVEADLHSAIATLNGQELKGLPIVVRADPDATVPLDEAEARRPAVPRSYRQRSRSPYERDRGGYSSSRRGGGRSPSPYERRRERDDSPPRRRRYDDSPPRRRREDSRERGRDTRGDFAGSPDRGRRHEDERVAGGGHGERVRAASPGGRGGHSPAAERYD